MIRISQQEKELFSLLKEKIPDLKRQIQIERYHYDICYKKKIIEYNGDYWHGNPNIYLFEDYVGNIINNRPTYAYELWARDEKKKQYAEKYGYTVFVVWEEEYLYDKKGTVKKCYEFLTN